MWKMSVTADCLLIESKNSVEVAPRLWVALPLSHAVVRNEKWVPVEFVLMGHLMCIQQVSLEPAEVFVSWKTNSTSDGHLRGDESAGQF